MPNQYDIGFVIVAIAVGLLCAVTLRTDSSNGNDAMVDRISNFLGGATGSTTQVFTSLHVAHYQAQAHAWFHSCFRFTAQLLDTTAKLLAFLHATISVALGEEAATIIVFSVAAALLTFCCTWVATLINILYWLYYLTVKPAIWIAMKLWAKAHHSQRRGTPSYASSEMRH